MESITITGLRITAYHGVMPQERRVGNQFIVDIRLDVDAKKAMESDDLSGTVNYAEVIEIVKHEMAIPSKLLEHVAARIRQALNLRYGARINGGSVTVSKLAPPISVQLDSVSFTTRW